jgi:hypothetical protein
LHRSASLRNRVLRGAGFIYEIIPVSTV